MTTRTRAEDTFNIGGLRLEYKRYERQKCFVGHSREAEWCQDSLSACAEILPKSGLEPWYAADHFDPTKPLRDKVVELIANARYGIYDLSSWQDRNGEWHLPRNVLIELGMAIALNRPALLLRHTSNQELPLPACLQGVELLEFAGDTTLKKALEERVPQWLDAPPDRDWLNRFCIFGNRVCDFREEHPRARQWGHKTLRCHLSDGLDKDYASFKQAERDEIRGAFEEVLRRYSDLTFDYLDELLLADGYRFLLCSHCQAVRSTPFAVYRILPDTPAEVFIAIGMSIALESLFEYDIPKVLVVREEQDLPSLLRGYEVVEAVNSSEVKRKLRKDIPSMIQKVRKIAWKPRPLPFIETSGRSYVEPVPLPRAEPPGPVSINELLRQRVEQLRKSEPHISVQSRLDPRLVAATVRVSPEWLRQALDILLDNAIKAMDVSPNRQLTVATHWAGDGVEITVSDTGPGIPEDLRPILFRPIESTKNTDGLGTGLFMAQNIVRRYGGEIRLGSTGAAGTTMVVWLPAEVDESDIVHRIYDTPIEELDLSVRTYNLLKSAGITQVGEILAQLAVGEDELLVIRGFGQKSLEELEASLATKGFLSPTVGEQQETDAEYVVEERPTDTSPEEMLLRAIFGESISRLSDMDMEEPSELREETERLLGSLSTREARVLQLRYGLSDGKPETLQEVGERFGVTEERIREIETEALRRLRHPTRSRTLRRYLISGEQRDKDNEDSEQSQIDSIRGSLMLLLVEFERALRELVEWALHVSYGQDWPAQLRLEGSPSHLTQGVLVRLVRDQKEVFEPLFATPEDYNTLVTIASEITAIRNAIVNSVQEPDESEMQHVEQLIERLLPAIREAQNAIRPRFLQVRGDEHVYWFDVDGTRHWIPDGPTLESLGSWEQVRKLDRFIELKRFSPGNPLPSAIHGERPWLVSVRGETEVYLIDEEGYRHQVPDSETRDALVGGPEGVDPLVSLDELERFPLGAPYSLSAE